MATFFTADTHFGHGNIVNYCDRPFQNLEEHNRCLIENWNSIVGPKDHVYHLGDFGWGPIDELTKLAGKLRGKIHLIAGNHDPNVKRPPLSGRFSFIKDVHYYKGYNGDEKVEIFLSHYPHRSWLHSFHGSFHLFGHTHSRLGPHGLSFDVGVDNIYKLFGAYRPISLREVCQVMDTLRKDFDPEKIR